MEEGGRDPHASRQPGDRQGQVQVPRGGGHHHQHRAALARRGRRDVQPGARRVSRPPEAVRAHRQDHDGQEGLDQPAAQLPQDDQAAGPGGRLGEEGHAARALARAGRDLPLAPQDVPRGGRGLRGVCAPRARQPGPAPDPGRAVPGPGTRVLRQGHPRVPPAHRAREGSERHGPGAQDPAAPLRRAGQVRPGVVCGLHAVLLEAGRRRGAALLRAVPQQGLGAREVAPDRGELAEAPLPPARGPLHLAGAGQHQPDRHRDSRARAPGIRHQAQGSPRPGHRPADAEPGVRVRRPSARREHAGAVPAAGLGRRHGLRQRSREAAALSRAHRRQRTLCRAGRRRSWPMRSASD